jgi:23S rRNA pseudouridine1911/1915/1917 synthase
MARATEPQVIFEDDDVLVVDKPAPLVCHSASRPEHPTLVAWVREYLSKATTVHGNGTPHLNPLPQGERRNPPQSPRPAGGEAGPVTTGTGEGKTRCTIVPRLINRLDRETSGLVIVAKNERAARILGKQVLRREIQKEYVAICWGEFEQENGVVDKPIGLTKESVVYTKRVVVPTGREAGKPCVTEFAVERRLTGSIGGTGVPARAIGGCTGTEACATIYKTTSAHQGFTVVRLRPRTGRAHQLRVHMAWLGHPIVGDKVYGPDETLYLQFIKEGVTEEMLGQLLLPRHALHAECVAFRHPGTGLSCEFRAELPADMKTFIDEHS